MLTYTIEQNFTRTKEEAHSLLQFESEILVTNIGTKLGNIRHRLDYLASLPTPALLDPARCDPGLKHLLAMHPEYTNIVTTDLSGTLVCSALPIAPGEQPSAAKRPWFQRLLQEQRFRVGEPFVGEIAGKQVLIVSQPLREGNRPDGRMIGAIGITIAITAFDPMFPTKRIPQGSLYGFINDEGTLIWRNQNANEIGTRMQNDAAKRGLEVRDGIYEGKASDGILRDYAVKSLPEFGLLAFVGIPSEGIHSTAQRDVIRLVSFSAALLIVLLGIAAYIARRIALPLHALGTTARAIQAGDDSVRASVTGPGEISALATAFNAMVDARQQADEALRHQTADLQTAKYALDERIKELACLYDIFRLTEDEAISMQDLLRQTVERLPAALRFPETAAAHVDFEGQSIGSKEAKDRSPSLSVEFGGGDGQLHRLTVAYLTPLVDGTTPAFLPEEEALVKAIGLRLSSTLGRRQAALIEKDNQALMHAMVEESPYAIELIDIESLRFVAANAAACRQLGYSREELLGMTLADVQGMFSPQEFQDKVRAVVAAGKASFENRRKRRDGTLIDVQIDVHVIQRGHRTLMVDMWSEITARKRAEAQIRMLSMAVDQSPNTVLITDLAADTVYVNDAFTRITGYGREEILGRNPRMLKSGKTPAATYDAMWCALTAGDTWTGELINRARDGSEQIHATTIVPIRGEDGKVCQYVAVKEDVTEQRRNEDRLRKLSLAVDQSPESIVITNLDARIEYVNQAFIRNTGYSWEEAIGANPRVLQSGKTPLATYQDMWATLTRGQPWRGELYNARKDGSEYVEHAIIAPVRQPDGKVTHYLAIKEDVTEKKRMSDELDAYRSSLEQQVVLRTAELAAVVQEQNALFDSAGVGIILIRNMTIVRCNHRMDEMFGYASGELVDQPVQCLYPTDISFQERLDQGIPRLVRGETYVSEDRGLRKDGSQIWARSSAHLLDVTDPSRGLIAIVEDTSAERAMLDALRLANEEQQAIFDSAGAGMVLMKDRTIVRCNRRMDEMLGYAYGEQIGKPTRMWYPDEASYELVGREGYKAVWRGDTDVREQLLVRKDGSTFWARMSARAVDTADHSKGTVSIIEDTTTERAAVQAIRKAQEMAEEAARIKADFLANMSHEIRTPMNAVMGMTHLVLKTELTTRQRQYLTKIQDASKHLLGIINDILDFSKIEAGKMSVEHIDFELDKVLDNVVNLIADRATAKGLELILDVASDVPNHLVGDPLRIGQVLINYANNAVKFTDQGEIALHVRVATDTDHGLLLHFSVRDTGPGIDAEHLQHLFQSFQQADSSTTRKFGGTGLGLAIAKRLTELMGGTVGVESQPGKGSAFWFTARLGKGKEEARSLLPDPDLRGRRVLVVDDNDYAREVVADMLRSMTFVVGMAASGKAAVAEIQRASAIQEPYEIVFLDWQMPGMDGIATAHEIRRLPLAKLPHLIMITAHGREELHKPAEQAGIEDILTKPLNPSLLFDTVMHALATAQLERAVSARPEAPRPSQELTAIRGARILLVEDNALNQEVATAFLHELGLEVDIADNGRIAVDKVKAGRYDAVLMDMQMPVLDGLAATREIRQLPGQDHLPILSMTANALAEDRQRCIEAGMNDHMTKPIDPELLSSKLLQWIRPRGQALPAATDQGNVQGAEPSGLPFLDGIEGLDVHLGLRQAMGREKLYVSLLEKFVQGGRDWSARMAAALEQPDMASARLLAHSLKGVSAQVGALRMRDLAQSLEHAIEQHEAAQAIGPRLREAGIHLAMLLNALEERLPANHAEPTALAIDSTSLVELCSQLVQSFEHDDFASGQLVDEHEGPLRSLLGTDFNGFAEAVHDFDFGTALLLLKKAMASQGMTPQEPV
ncbi:MAG: hypothetical protein A3F76_08430 [Burkholderiales bacterium RIFCSPLOWO2_12_FULL_65_40]|nr:MAG: hypothetical protein A3F76_08430 [Burkholderiales bacterium RIFCSPLOWO2_12_FULL_65_40]